MRLLLYNIRYATGTGPGFHLPLPGAGYLRNTSKHLEKITDFIRVQEPDIVGLVEVDMGSSRASSVNQAEAIAKAIGHSPHFQNKYGLKSINRHLPIVNKQGNAFLTRYPEAIQRAHYFELGIKRLIMELELEEVCLFLVHLSLKRSHRHQQMHHLASLVKNAVKPVILAGDFNTLWGDHEIAMLIRHSGFINANIANLPSWPSNRPFRQLDFVLHNPEIEVTHFGIPRTSLSDHLPLICDFRVRGKH
ncbi:MAG TPA: endonuclease/exonuclease/phosphatase family protein [Gammaproteobacteria bacterium]